MVSKQQANGLPDTSPLPADKMGSISLTALPARVLLTISDFSPILTTPPPRHTSTPATMKPANASALTQEDEKVPRAPPGVPYEIRAISNKGYGVFATQFLKRGTRILADDPLLIVPIEEYLEADIKEVFDELTLEQQRLYFSLHSAHGQDPAKWPSKIHPSVPERERSRILEQHNARLGKEPSLVSIFQTNCMEVEDGAGIFPNAARFNHSCNPNAVFSWNEGIRKEVIHATRDIAEGEEITLSYCNITYDKDERTWQLKHYGFKCDCEACTGDISDINSFASKSADRRWQLRELEEDFVGKRGSHLERGMETEGFVEKLLQYVKVLLEEGDYGEKLAHA